MKKATHQDTKKHNTRLVLKTIYDEGQISRVNIAEQTFLTRPTVSDIVSELADARLIEEVGIGPSVGGKPPILLSVAENARCLLGMDLANSEFRGALINLRGKILYQTSLPVLDRDGEAALGLVYQLAEALIAAAESPVLGIGIGTPGLVDAASGVVHNSVNLDWRDLPLKARLEERFGLPCHVTNDSQVAALAEMTFGAGRGFENLAVVKLGRGVGAGIVIGRQLYHGDGFGAGEIGHVVVKKDGDLCNCGRRGCLETVISTRAILKHARLAAESDPASALNRLDGTPDEVALATIAGALAAGDIAAQATLYDPARYLGRVLATMVAALNIHHVVLAGSLAQLGDGLIGPVRAEIGQRVLPAVAADTSVEVSELGDDIVLLGSAALVLSAELGIA